MISTFIILSYFFWNMVIIIVVGFSELIDMDIKDIVWIKTFSNLLKMFFFGLPILIIKFIE